jgi:hypothetical protein
MLTKHQRNKLKKSFGHNELIGESSVGEIGGWLVVVVGQRTQKNQKTGPVESVVVVVGNIRLYTRETQ